MKIRTIGSVCAALLLIAACGEPASAPATSTAATSSPTTSTTTTIVGGEAELNVIVTPDGDGMPTDVMLSCPSGPSFPASALDAILPVEDIDIPGLDAAMQEFLDTEEGEFWPQDGWRVLHQTDGSVAVVHLDEETGAISFMDLSMDGGELRWAGASSGGDCSLQTTLPEDLGVVTWRVDPDAGELAPEATSIVVLVTERGCAGGEPMGDRLMGPQVVMTDTEVLIAFAARAQTGAQECPSNPETAVVVELPEPLGDRTLRDGLDTGLDLTDFLE